MIRIGGTKYVEQFWDHKGVVLRSKAVEPQGEARDFTWISTELARRTGLLEPYNKAINRGAGGRLAAEGARATTSASTRPRLPAWSRSGTRSAARRAPISPKAARTHDLAWFKEHGFYTVPMSAPGVVPDPDHGEQGLRYELPYQERLLRIGRELGNRLHEQKMHWWDDQLSEYTALPEWHDVSRALDPQPGERPARKARTSRFWLLTTKSMQYHAGGNVSIALMREVAQNVRGHAGVIMNAKTAAPRHRRRRPHRGALAHRRHLRQGGAAQGMRPDTLVIMGQFDHWATPYAKDLEAPSLNTIAPMSLDLTDATGSGADIVRGGGARIGGAAMTRYAMTIDLRRCVGCQTCTAACKGANATPPGIQWRRVLDIESGEFPDVRRSFLPVGLHALRRSAVRAGLPDHRHHQARRRPGGDRLRPVHRLRQLRHGLSLRRALDCARTALCLRRSADGLRGQALRPGAHRRLDEMHLLQGPHRPRPHAPASSPASIPR
jgi:hypothetical protein